MPGSSFGVKVKDLLISLIVIVTITLFLIVPFFRPDLSVYITIVALGASLALQKYIASFVGHFVIGWSSAFDIGDRIRIGTIKGDVRHIGLFHIILDEVGDDGKMGGELTGRLLHIPNLLVLDQPILNYSKDYSVKDKHISSGYIFDEVRIPLKPTSDVKKAVAILEELLWAENSTFVKQAQKAFGEDGLPNFLHELQNGPRVSIYFDEERIWIKGRFVTTIHTKNELKTKIGLEFIERIRGDNCIQIN